MPSGAVSGFKHCTGFYSSDLPLLLVFLILMVMVLLSAIENAQSTAHRSQCMGHLKHFGVAMLDFADKNRHFPSAHTDIDEVSP